jgi:regulator of sigma E protease
MLTTIISGLFVLGVAVLVHEFGHFIVAKLGGVYVKVFSIGFGKRLLQHRWGETLYAISALPFGGYVKFAGESELTDEPEPVSDEPRGRYDDVPDSEIPRARYFTTQKRWIRAAVLFAGPFMNYMLAVGLYTGVLLVDGVDVIPTTRVGEIVAKSPAAELGFAVGDSLISIAGNPVHDWYDVGTELVANDGSAKSVTFWRDGEVQSVTVAPRREDGQLTVGFYPFISSRIGRVQKNGPAARAGIEPGSVIEAINDTLVTSYDDVRRIIHANLGTPLYVRWTHDGLAHADTIIPEPKEVLKAGSTSETTKVGVIGIAPYTVRRGQSLLTSVKSGFSSTHGMIVQIVGYLEKLLTGRMGVRTLGGPILISQMAGDMANWGFDSLLLFLALFNINLCVFNLVPILPFDGGHLAILAYEGIVRRPINRRVREWLMQGGLVLIILLMIFVVVLDLTRCAGSVPGGF